MVELHAYMQQQQQQQQQQQSRNLLMSESWLPLVVHYGKRKNITNMFLYKCINQSIDSVTVQPPTNVLMYRNERKNVLVLYACMVDWLVILDCLRISTFWYGNKYCQLYALYHIVNYMQCIILLMICILILHYQAYFYQLLRNWQYNMIVCQQFVKNFDNVCEQYGLMFSCIFYYVFSKKNYVKYCSIL
eukprot:TRINITY_DN1841_c0_g1_i3.p4 TRINITY_DN1841_c0_g1~~TRINITY_DN1841_c0_g1_i3.p4  ORF type:complete len:189 (+),score=0.55 TRINITY_DN1841_c0_g1_i3:1623-2189(+)